MRRSFFRFLSLPLSLFILFGVCLSAPADDNQPASLASSTTPEQNVDFRQDIQPILRKSCWSCHGAETQESGLRLDNKRRAFEGGDSGRAIVAGHSEQSLLIDRIAGSRDESIMPPAGEGTPLTKEQVALLRAWIEQGADWPDNADDAALGSSHWSFQPLASVAIPPVHDGEWPRGAIDAFVLRRLEQEGVSPSSAAKKAILCRRLHLDLLGVPPTPDVASEFVADTRADAWERLVDRVLASPHYGERFGRHWLDLARYADSDGYEKDRPRPYAWRYREWVINALNADMPFDRFSTLQIAGDLLPQAGVEEKVATGFHRNTLHNTEGGADPEEDRAKKTVDRTNTFGAIWLGMTVGCAQCHTHKYDPITHREYFSLYGFFNNIEEVDIPAPLASGREANEQPNAGKEKDKPAKSSVKAQAVSERSAVRPTHVHIRGDFLTKGDRVELGAPAALPPIGSRDEQLDRLDLANWVFNSQNPLTARVTTNRLWQRLFGRGLVATVDDFGAQGQPPSHPQLLDWLARELTRDNWSLKSLQRRILCSAAYRQSSSSRPEASRRDPENSWLARQSRRRVESEVVRDLALAASGLWDPRVGGPSVRPPQPDEYDSLTYANSAKWQVSKGGDRYRRGLYTFFQRTSPYPMLMTFDSPDSNTTCAKRQQSNTPLQALTLWNDKVFFECAQALARRVVREAPPSESAQQGASLRAEHAVMVCLSRKAEPAETAALVDLWHRQEALAREDIELARAIVSAAPIPGNVSVSELAAWVLVGRTLLNLDEFITRE